MKNKAKAIEAIKNDCKTRMEYINHDGETCAVGQLAIAAGVDLSPLLRDYSVDSVFDTECKNTKIIGMGYTKDIEKAIFETFGLSVSELRQIQSLNDRFETPKARQQAILNYLDTLPETP